MSSRRHPLAAALGSLILPGGGQLYNREWAKGFAIVCMDIGIAVGMALSLAGPPVTRSLLGAAGLGVIYLCVWIPSVVDAYQTAGGGQTALLSGDRPWYVITMLLMVGPGAIPLLWQSRRFSRAAKLAWTAAVIAVALFGILFIVVISPKIEPWLRSLTGPMAY